MLRKYEGLFIINAESSEEEQKKIIAQVTEMIAKGDGQLENPVSLWGKRRLAYDIKGHNTGLYLLAEFRLDPGSIAELEKAFRRNEHILRTLITAK